VRAREKSLGLGIQLEDERRLAAQQRDEPLGLAVGENQGLSSL